MVNERGKVEYFQSKSAGKIDMSYQSPTCHPVRGLLEWGTVEELGNVGLLFLENFNSLESPRTKMR